MPDVIFIRRVDLTFSDLSHRTPIPIPPVLSRAPGLHQSDILKFAAVKIGKLKPSERLEEDYPWRMAMGNMWEEFYFSLHPEYEWHPGEQTVDEISVNCDG